MSFWDFISTVALDFLANAAIIVFLHCFYDTAFLWHKKKMLLFLASTIIFTVFTYTFPGSVFLLFVSTIISCLIATYDYTGRKLSGFWRFGVYILLSNFLIVAYASLVDISIASILWSNISPESTGNADFVYAVLGSSSALVANIIGILFFGIVFLCLYPLYRKGIVVRCGKWETWVLFAGTFLSDALFFCIALGIVVDNIQLVLFPTAILGICVSLLFPIMLYYSRIGEYFRKRTALQESHIQAELAHFQQYRKNQEETSRFRHDIKNNLLCISNMLQQGKTAEASNYLKDLLDIVENLSMKYVTGDELLDSIVGVKTQTMEQHGIQFDLDGMLAGGLSWKPVDICNVFANTFDNAIEACQKVPPERRRISMHIKSTPQFWFVTIENSVAEVVDTAKLFQKNGGYTSKSNSAQHGIGTYNMKHTVESYGAMLKAECTDEIFILEIMIHKSMGSKHHAR